MTTYTRWASNDAGGYVICGHTGCHKKVDETITDHACCGRCRQGRRCRQATQESYTGPGLFPHRYTAGTLRPGICTTCDEPREAHPTPSYS